MTNFGINFVSAQDAGLTLTIETLNGEIQRRAKDAQDVADWIKEFGIASRCFFSSTMDFAAEEGFADDDGAVKLFDRGVLLASSGVA